MNGQLDLMEIAQESAGFSSDPNADLIGMEFDGITVLRSCSWSATYMEVQTPNGLSCRSTALLRAHR